MKQTVNVSQWVKVDWQCHTQTQCQCQTLGKSGLAMSDLDSVSATG